MQSLEKIGVVLIVEEIVESWWTSTKARVRRVDRMNDSPIVRGSERPIKTVG